MRLDGLIRLPFALFDGAITVLLVYAAGAPGWAAIGFGLLAYLIGVERPPAAPRGGAK